MGTLRRRTVHRPVPQSATISEKNGQTFARWKSRGKWHVAPITETNDGTRTVVVEVGTYSGRYLDHTGKTVERSTGCKDETNARQKLAKWEKEAEQIRAGVLDAGELDTARTAVGPIEPHLADYLQSLVVAQVSDVYRTNADRSIRRLMRELGLEVLRDLRRDKIEPWFANAIFEDMGACNRNLFRQSIVSFANWLAEAKRIREHDLAGIPVAVRRLDPRRQRRSLTPDEIGRLLDVAAARPLDDARTLRTGKRKGERTAEVRPEVVERLLAIGRERVMIYRTLLFTGLRCDELRTLTVARLDLTPGSECVILEASNEKNGNGSTIPLRADLAADIRQWIGERQLAATDRLFTVPAGLRRILDRDLKAAGIPKRDDRGKTIDVHALRGTFCTMLSTTGTAPRTAQAAMRHSNIGLTMNTYTDPRLLAVREAVERLPEMNAKSSLPTSESDSVHDCARTGGPNGHFLTLAGTMKAESKYASNERLTDGNPCFVNEKPPVTSGVTGGRDVERRRVELPTSSLRTKRSTK